MNECWYSEPSTHTESLYSIRFQVYTYTKWDAVIQDAFKMAAGIPLAAAGRRADLPTQLVTYDRNMVILCVHFDT